jgi:phage I-like protein
VANRSALLAVARTELNACASAAVVAINARGEERATASGTELLVVADQPPKTVQLFPMGRHVARDGRGPWELVDRAHAERVVAATLARLGSTELMFDYDHQAVTAEKTGGQAPASGWVKKLHVRDDGIWGDVEWTPAASARIVAKEYRYVSPWFGFEKETGRLTRLFNAALTNIPALEMAAVAAQSPDGDHMNLKAIAKALGLAEDATEEQVLAAIAKNNTGATAAAAAMAAVANALGVAADAKPEELAAAAAAAKTGGGAFDPTQFVPIAQFELVQSQVKTIVEDKHTASVDKAIADGKLAPAARDWALSLEASAFAKFVDVTPAVLGPSGAGGKPAPKDGELTDEEKAICSQLGLSEEDFKKSKEALA